MTKIFLIIFLQIILAWPAAAAEFTGQVIGVADGDSITVLHQNRPVKVRLLGIDCPEKGQPFGRRAKQFTARLAFGQIVTVIPRGRDRYRRTLAEVILPDHTSLNQALVEAGYAWHFTRYSADPDLAALEAQAQTNKSGLWSGAAPLPPWQFRRGQKATKQK